jgi:hypothetical protein
MRHTLAQPNTGLHVPSHSVWPGCSKSPQLQKQVPALQYMPVSGEQSQVFDAGWHPKGQLCVATNEPQLYASTLQSPSELFRQ